MVTTFSSWNWKKKNNNIIKMIFHDSKNCTQRLNQAGAVMFSLYYHLYGHYGHTCVSILLPINLYIQQTCWATCVWRWFNTRQEKKYLCGERHSTLWIECRTVRPRQAFDTIVSEAWCEDEHLHDIELLIVEGRTKQPFWM